MNGLSWQLHSYHRSHNAIEWQNDTALSSLIWAIWRSQP